MESDPELAHPINLPLNGASVSAIVVVPALVFPAGAAGSKAILIGRLLPRLLV